MKTLKRSLSLVLVLALAFSLCATAFAAVPENLEKFKDANKVTFTEAVDVLVGIDIVDGIDATTLSPQGVYTRAQGAALIARLILGRTATEKLDDRVSPFTDVPVGYWAAGEIDFCVSQGIINGNGDGTFDPEGHLTGYAVLKMALCALGYGAQGEFIGETWMVNTSKFAFSKNINLVDGIVGSKDYTKTATREEAMLYVFNTFYVAKVEWSALIGQYVTRTEIHGDYRDAHYTNDVHDLSARYGEWSGPPWNRVFTADKDALGYNVRTWYVNEYVISDSYIVDTILEVVPSTITGGELFAKKSSGDYGFDSALELYVNGTDRSSLTAGFASSITKGNLNKPFGAYTGAHITLVDTDDDFEDVDKIIMVVEYLAKVTRVNEENSTRDRSINIEVLSNTVNAAGKLPVDWVETEEFSVGDYILIVPNSDTNAGFKEPLSMKLAESATSKVSAYTDSNPGNSSVTIASGKYAYNFTNASSTTGFDYSADYKFYFDTEGNVIGYEKAKVSRQYIYVTNSVQQADGSFLLSTDGKATVKIDVTYFDGESKVLDVEIKTATSNMGGGIIRGDKYFTIDDGTGTLTHTEVGTGGTPIASGVYTYTANSNGVSLTEDNFKANSVKVLPNDVNVAVNGTANTHLATASTNLVIVRNGLVSSYTGYQSFRNETYQVTVNDVEHVAYLAKDDVISDILVIGASDFGARTYVYGVFDGSYGNAKDIDGNWMYRFETAPNVFKDVVSPTALHLALPALVDGNVYRVEIDANNEVIALINTSVGVAGSVNGFEIGNILDTITSNTITTTAGFDVYYKEQPVKIYDVRDADNNTKYDFKEISAADLKSYIDNDTAAFIEFTCVYSIRANGGFNATIIFITGDDLPAPPA